MGLLPFLLKESKASKWINHRNLYLLGLATLICGLGWSNALMSLGQFILVGNWIIELNFQSKFKALKYSKILWILFSLYFLHLLGLIWTTDYSFGFKDLRIKLPLLLLPLVIGTTPKLDKNEILLLFKIYIITLVILTLTSLGKLNGWWGEPILDKRQLSIYISHIRYGLNLAIACVILGYQQPFGSKTLNFIFVAWFFICLLLFQLYSGFLFLVIICSIYLSFILIKKAKTAYLKEIIAWSSLLIVVFISYQFYSVYQDYKTVPEINYNQNEVENQYTLNGEAYWSDLQDHRKENGIYVRRFIAWKELERAWNSRSEMDFWSPDLKGQTLDQTLNRYLSSKGLKKDSLAVSQLSKQEVEAIEKGIANVYYLENNSLKSRLHKTYYELSEYQRTGIADGFSLALRIEYWKTSLDLIKSHFVFGVGTGDIKNAFLAQYEKNNTLLDEKYRNRAHNQFLSIFITFGIVGFLLFIIYLVYPIWILRPNKTLYILIVGILILSFLTEDTLETQAGVSLFAFFNTLFLVGVKQLK